MTKTRNCASGSATGPPCRPGWLLAGLIGFGIAFGFVEAVVVVDLRAILSPLVSRTDPLSADEVLPLIAFDRQGRADPVAMRLMQIEVLREAATLAMLVGVGLAAGRTFLQRFAAFLMAFGVWDLCYYVSLKWLIGWPASVWTWDVLFLVPVPWAAPVFAPAIAALAMVAAGATVLVREANGRPVRLARWDWAAIVVGGMILIAAFCWDWRNIAAGGTPNPFPWPLFLTGFAIGLGGFGRGALGPRPEGAAVPGRNALRLPDRPCAG